MTYEVCTMQKCVQGQNGHSVIRLLIEIIIEMRKTILEHYVS